ncbi:ABC transporter permease [Paenibacillus favisporus]|uniref:ABC transporter permease n=1 Tax=Paenibacillus favisporus TaxID=221028 RepID=UPI003D280920
MGLSVNPAAKAARKPSALPNWIKRVRKHKHYLILLAPGIIYLLLFNYWPMFGITIAFKDFKLSEGIFGSDWAGLKWFRILFDSPDFWVALRNTLIISLYKLVFNFPAPIMLALLLNEVFHSGFKRIIQTIVYFPHFVSWVILGGILFSLFSTDSGLLEFLGISTSPLMDPGSFRSLLVASDVWKEVGWGTIIYLAAITGISPDLYDAGRMDGASRFRLIWHITLPSIAGTIVVLLILRTGHILNVGFDQIFVLYNPLVYSVADVLETYVYRVGISMGRFSFATAAGMFQSVIGLVMLLITNQISKRLTGHGIW